MRNENNGIEILKHIDTKLEEIENKINRTPQKYYRWQDAYSAKVKKN